MLKLLQEVSGFAQFTTKSNELRPNNPLLLQFRSATRRKAAARTRRTVRINMREQPDIPQPVPITFLDSESRS